MDKQLDKLRMLMEAIRHVQGEEPDFIGELKECGREILEEEPGLYYHEWCDRLFRMYPQEVVDAFGTNDFVVEEKLREMWDALQGRN